MPPRRAATSRGGPADQAGHLVIANAGNNSLSTFTLDPDGTVTLIDSVGNGQAGTCWVTGAAGTLSRPTPAPRTSAATPPAPEYLAQMRKTIELTGTLTADDLTPQMQDEFIDLYRQWRAGRPGDDPPQP